MKICRRSNLVVRLCSKLGITIVMMFIFTIVIMPSLYDLFCDITGLNGKTGDKFSIETIDASSSIDRSRTVKVQFLASNNKNMPWIFKPQVESAIVHPGEITVINYFASNNTQMNMVAQAIPSLVPFKAAKFFHKTECFCFNEQSLEAGKSIELGLSFIVDIHIPKYIKTITLSYTLFDITKTQWPI